MSCHLLGWFQYSKDTLTLSLSLSVDELNKAMEVFSRGTSEREDCEELRVCYLHLQALVRLELLPVHARRQFMHSIASAYSLCRFNLNFESSPFISGTVHSTMDWHHLSNPSLARLRTSLWNMEWPRLCSDPWQRFRTHTFHYWPSQGTYLAGLMCILKLCMPDVLVCVNCLFVFPDTHR